MAGDYTVAALLRHLIQHNRQEMRGGSLVIGAKIGVRRKRDGARRTLHQNVHAPIFPGGYVGVGGSDYLDQNRTRAIRRVRVLDAVNHNGLVQFQEMGGEPLFDKREHSFRSDENQNMTTPNFRVGIGYDSHRLVEGRPLLLAGVTVPFEKGLQGHSDADVLLHAITDALCGAAGLPDIGRLFPDTDDDYKDADSGVLLRGAALKVREEGWEIVNLDAILIAQQPKIAPFVPQMKTNVARLLEIEESRVNLRGKTAEKLDDVGAGLGMQAHAVALIVKLEGFSR